ncbi:hypothetical protein SETIT_4G236200v2 [Setaria italica]|uniref:Uncharacterized protein n=1 Tax=Setaria italica TaxID=4555 RepID=A0A368QXT0_SETIT|nr:hypothetical protein SETIT_4G236200v2 [Setaria italica]
MVQACSQKWPDRQSWTKYFRNMVQPSRHGLQKSNCFLNKLGA